jgi:adenylate cyclase, class 2
VQNIGIEKKFEAPDIEALRARLRVLGGKPGEPAHQVDAYFNAPHRDFLAPEAISEWLRVRTEDGGSCITYQRWFPVDAVTKTHADEFESKVDDVEAIRRLLQMLDFHPIVTIDKTREEWQFPNVGVAIDHVLHAGDFVEFQYQGEAETAEDATAELDEFIKSLDVELGDQITRGYPEILLGREH